MEESKDTQFGRTDQDARWGNKLDQKHPEQECYFADSRTYD